MVSVVAVVCGAPRAAGREVAGGALPYGLARLEPRFDVRWIDGHHRALQRPGVLRATDGLVRRASPGRRGMLASRAVRLHGGAAEAVLSVFEDTGLAFARHQAGLAPTRRTPHVIVGCWLAEDARTKGPAWIRSTAASLAAVDAICVYSRNQVPLVTELLGVDQRRIHVVPFGVDVDWYAPGRVSGRPGGGGVVAVGGDSRRDYATLFDAARMIDATVTVSCRPENVAGLDTPDNVRIVSVFGAAYRELLHRADVVVTTTTAPAYPSGQSVVLEAMAMARPTVTTDSPAMREYVDDGVTGLLAAPGDAAGVADRVSRLLNDAEARDAMGTAARGSVVSRFTFDHMWTATGDVLAATIADGRSR